LETLLAEKKKPAGQVIMPDPYTGFGGPPTCF